MGKVNGPRLRLRIVDRRVADLVPYARNARTHNADQVAQIAASITEFGFTNPVLVDEKGGIIAGHGRVLAAQQLKLPNVPCIALAHLTKAQKRAYVLADNKIALNGGWDEELLRAELLELKTDGFELRLTGFSDEEATALLDTSVPEVEFPEFDESVEGEVRMIECPKCGHRFAS